MFVCIKLYLMCICDMCLLSVGPVELQVRQDDQQVAVAAQQVLLGQNQALQKRRPRHGQSVAGSHTFVCSFAIRFCTELHVSYMTLWCCLHVTLWC